MNSFPQLIKRLTMTPVVEGVKPLAKSRSRAGDIGELSEYLTLTGYKYIENVPIYVRRQLFQWNYSLPFDFYLLNVESYQSLARYVINGGCLCIKYRVGETVYRYNFLDHNPSEDWSGFTKYFNHRIKKNFCIEFWANELLSYESWRGLSQGLTLKLSNIIIPDSIEQGPGYYDIPNPPYTLLTGLSESFPEDVPDNDPLYVTTAWLDNVQTAQDILELNNVNIRIIPSSLESTYRLQLRYNGEWITIGTDGLPPQVDLTGTNLRFKNGKGPQWHNPDTTKWHTITVESVPPQIFIDQNGED